MLLTTNAIIVITSAVNFCLTGNN